MYLLAKHPEVQEKVLCEIKEAGLDKNATNSSGDAMIKNLPLLKGVIREALRLYPVAPFLTRILPEDCPIGGYNVPAGDILAIQLMVNKK
ncbi:hypothetical protein J437_LFUL008614 [Ladona fulva]|uniref:Cytochrome P450 n=1 Tax=Ladona fulva TaxID=123851 RepID=A0A8K0P4B6_LADFU|nr:hypothetical protein J437_LFUL008614 [Ladona fulva]